MIRLQQGLSDTSAGRASHPRRGRSWAKTVAGKTPCVGCIPPSERRALDAPHVKARASGSLRANLICTKQTPVPARLTRRSPECIRSSGVLPYRVAGSGTPPLLGRLRGRIDGMGWGGEHAPCNKTPSCSSCPSW